ncbi:MAG: cellulase family glycosylhydrolase [Theionarchaea archaeon]|nr:cellulase family glycosylhydrolase [Theionarchaea archaeon]
MALDSDEEWFLDSCKRRVLLRGVNLGGSSKVPSTPDGSTFRKTDFSDHEDVSFMDRPFPAEDAADHFTRLKRWGFNCLRFLTTWEALQHGGPYKYDGEYLDYLEDMICMAGEYGFYVFVDMHQDVWSRMTGGDGAPGWLFEKVGLDYTRFDSTDAAQVMQYRYPHDYPAMCWVQNYQRFAAATMFTLFFGGSDFAPSLHIDGCPVQEYMQDTYIAGLTHIAHRLKDMNHVLGYDCMNEPNPGYIGVPDLSIPGGMAGQLVPGPQISPFDGMAAAGGFPRTVRVAELHRLGVSISGERVINPDGTTCWHEDREDIWRKEGIWDIHDDEPILLRPHHFSTVNDNPVVFFSDYLIPFIDRCAREIRKIHPPAFIFLEGEPFHPETLQWDLDRSHIIHASHWYDAVTLITKKFQTWYSYDVSTRKIVLFNHGIRSMVFNQLKRIKDASRKIGDGIPTLIGEFGIPLDMYKKRAYSTGDFSRQVEAFTMYYDVLDSLLLNGTLWNYTSDNTNERGDQWNGEDFSIFSRDQQESEDIWSGSRAIEGFCRPYARRTAGTPQFMSFDRKRGTFTYRFNVDTAIDAPTEIFLPSIQFPHGCIISVDNGTYEVQGDSLMVFTENPGNCTVTIERKRS